jgi:hypothetical protein
MLMVFNRVYLFCNGVNKGFAVNAANLCSIESQKHFL